MFLPSPVGSPMSVRSRFAFHCLSCMQSWSARPDIHHTHTQRRRSLWQCQTMAIVKNTRRWSCTSPFFTALFSGRPWSSGISRKSASRSHGKDGKLCWNSRNTQDSVLRRETTQVVRRGGKVSCLCRVFSGRSTAGYRH